MKVNYISTNWTYEAFLGRGGGGMYIPCLKFKTIIAGWQGGGGGTYHESRRFLLSYREPRKNNIKY